ncbi:outer membrane beta-barrel protein [Parasphaerochaeta coccoides]|uniref:Outer membrane protein beta-barrel domain-containing protein n=1 Tax=Parasphaerochaeta coccoides (strain ATCC BAA-1237 / DSM 17374 / SPN1) TaxID=760011 RepID=F4GHA1_PARC1|nr:outer membrane beta-barrel protein [Parasphaerochaeta coccoides]AEC02000.1 hypothetical protein Spico_0775 [Parasphaerochaeta coccoides DSM 17374]
MKKCIVVFLVLLGVSGFLFAGVNYIGASVGVDFLQRTMTSEGASGSINQSATGLGFGVKGASYFGDNDEWGIGYSLGLVKMLSDKMNEIKVDVSDEPIVIDFGVKGQYRYAVSDELDLHAGVGFGYTTQTDEDSGAGLSLSISSIIGGVDLVYNVSDTIFVNAGLAIGIPVSGKMVVSSGGASASADLSVSGITFTPSIGVLYKF